MLQALLEAVRALEYIVRELFFPMYANAQTRPEAKDTLIVSSKPDSEFIFGAHS